MRAHVNRQHDVARCPVAFARLTLSAQSYLLTVCDARGNLHRDGFHIAVGPLYHQCRFAASHSAPNVSLKRIITPHPGEAATLLGQSTAAIQSDRREALQGLQVKYGGTAVLKGAGSLVSADDGAPWLCTSGNPGMAAPGMGDVLTGIIAALIAQGLSVQNAAIAGVDLHARAGDRAAARGERGLLASDLLGEIRGLVNA
jgi:hydroxyethylthiazole kinase-like uncharacterized protein yjeF